MVAWCLIALTAIPATQAFAPTWPAWGPKQVLQTTATPSGLYVALNYNNNESFQQQQKESEDDKKGFLAGLLGDLYSPDDSSTNAKDTGAPLASYGFWGAYLDRSTGLVYYYNFRTLESTWIKPNDRFPPVLLKPNVPKPLATQGDWSAFLDAENTGRIYYYNVKTDESRWDAPTLSFPEVKGYPKYPDALVGEGDWGAYADVANKGRIYYFNKVTGESRWDPPTKTFPSVKHYQKRMKKDKNYLKSLAAAAAATAVTEPVATQAPRKSSGGNWLDFLFETKVEDPTEILEKKSDSELSGATESKVKEVPTKSAEFLNGIVEKFEAFGATIEPQTAKKTIQPVTETKKDGPLSLGIISPLLEANGASKPSSAAIVPKEKPVQGSNFFDGLLAFQSQLLKASSATVNMGSKSTTGTRAIVPKTKQSQSAYFLKDITSVLPQAAKPSPGSPSLVIAKKPVQEKSKPPKTLPPAGTPVLSNWKQNADGSITGLISNSKQFRSGTEITTSPVKRGAKGGTVVRTGSGSTYFLK